MFSEYYTLARHWARFLHYCVIYNIYNSCEMYTSGLLRNYNIIRSKLNAVMAHLWNIKYVKRNPKRITVRELLLDSLNHD